MSDPGPRDAIFVGLISGTSMDGIDAALVRLGDRKCKVLSAESYPYPDLLAGTLRAVTVEPDRFTLDDIAQLDQWVGECFRDATLSLLQRSDTKPHSVRAIGSHGQTIRHMPRAEKPFSLQIGDPSVIAAGTGIDTVADFRRADMAAGGEGAPLAPAFHAWLFADPRQSRVVLNIGGIANITALPAGASATGFDTGPGNTLLDAWIRKCKNQPYDEGGNWAASGRYSESMLGVLLNEAYFNAPPPKSTGPEYFNLAWLHDKVPDFEEHPAEDVQATLTMLSARSIARGISQAAETTTELLVCGGGSRNDHLMSAISAELPGTEVATTTSRGLDADWMEAACFAWLAQRFLHNQPGNLPDVTGASHATVLGCLSRGHLAQP